jgi:hypothetical protein
VGEHEFLLLQQWQNEQWVSGCLFALSSSIKERSALHSSFFFLLLCVMKADFMNKPH